MTHYDGIFRLHKAPRVGSIPLSVDAIQKLS